MDYKEFAQKIKSKYPQYQDLDDKSLAQRMVDKYPQYSDVTFEDVSTPMDQIRQSAIRNPLPEEVRNEPGTIPLMGMLSGGAVKAALEPTIPLAEAIGETTQIPEPIRSPLSGLVGIAPELLGAKAALKAVPAIASGSRKMVSSLLKSPKKISPGTIGDSPAIAEEITNLPIQKEKDIQKLESLRKLYGEKISTAREQAGIPQGKMSELPIPEDIVSFADEMKIIGQRDTTDLLKSYGKEGLANLKDTVQVLRETNKIPSGTRLSAEINMAVNKIDDALATVSPELEEGLQGYRLTRSQMEETPDYYKQLARERKAALSQAKTSEKKGVTRKALIQTLKKTLPWIGGGAVAKFM